MSDVNVSSMHDARDAEDTRLLAAHEHNLLVECVYAPRLLDADCKTVADMQLVNAVCRFAELAVDR